MQLVRSFSSYKYSGEIPVGANVTANMLGRS